MTRTAYGPEVSRRTFLRLAGLSALLAACGASNTNLAPSATSSPIPRRTDTATPDPTFAKAPTPTNTATSTPTATPVATATSTPAPSPTETSSPTPTATPGPLRVISLIHGSYRALVVDSALQRFGVLNTDIRVDLGETVPDLKNYDAVIVAGGEYRPKEFELPVFQVERDRVFEALDAKVPILAICLGHQLLAYWLGGQVAERRWELGWLPISVTEAGQADPLLAGLKNPFYGFLWHGDQITRLPKDATILASTERCPVQCYRLRDLPVWGVQFNPQYDPVIAEAVLRAAQTLPKNGYNIDEMVATGYREYNDLAGRMFGNFLGLVQKG